MADWLTSLFCSLISLQSNLDAKFRNYGPTGPRFSRELSSLILKFNQSFALLIRKAIFAWSEDAAFAIYQGAVCWVSRERNIELH